MPQQIIVDIPEEGDIRIEVKGVIGAGCEDLTKELEEALGGVKGRKRKNEYHQKPTQTNQQKQ